MGSQTCKPMAASHAPIRDAGKECKNAGCEILVLNNEQLSPEQEMVQDLMTIIHCFSSRLYGLRNYKKTLILQVATFKKAAPMKHVAGQYLDRHPSGAHVYETLCKMKFGVAQPLAEHEVVNLGNRDGLECPECMAHLSGAPRGPRGKAMHLGTDHFAPSADDPRPNAGVSGAIHDQSHEMDHGRRLAVHSGLSQMERYGSKLVKSEETVHPGLDARTLAVGPYREEDFGVDAQDPRTQAMGATESDSYGEGDQVEQMGYRAAQQGYKSNACKYPVGGYFHRRWTEGWKRGARDRQMGVHRGQ